MPAAPLQGKTIVVTGVTGQVAEPVAWPWPPRTRWWVRPASRTRPPGPGSRRPGSAASPSTWPAGDVAGLPRDADYVVNFAVSKTNDWNLDLQANSGGLAWLMEHHQDATAFLHCSTTGVYKPSGHHVFAEDDQLGDNHGVWPFLRTYSISKIAAEATARWAAERFGLPTTVARLSVPYGDRGGWPAIHLEMMINGSEIPVHVDAPSVYHPLHQDDIVAMVPGLLGAARTPATTVNWGGDDAVSIEEWCGYFSRTHRGRRPAFAPTEHTIDSVQIDLTRMHQLVGPTTVGWQDGMRRMVAARHPELLSD